MIIYVNLILCVGFVTGTFPIYSLSNMFLPALCQSLFSLLLIYCVLRQHAVKVNMSCHTWNVWKPIKKGLSYKETKKPFFFKLITVFNITVGFGAFVDKTVLPYTNTNEKKLKRPCDEDTQQCQAAFSYRHVLNMTSSVDEFKRKVTEQFISGNLDSPEGSLDAIMQAAVCGVRNHLQNSTLLWFTSENKWGWRLLNRIEQK